MDRMAATAIVLIVGICGAFAARSQRNRTDSPFFTPAQVQLRAQIAQKAAAANALPSGLTAAFLDAAQSSELNGEDAPTAINSTVQALLPWPNPSRILFNPASVITWTGGGVPVSGNPTQDQRIPFPSTQPRVSCCALLDALQADGSSTTGFRSNLPVVVFNTGGKVVPIRTSVPASVCTCGTPTDYEGAVDIEVRGSSSAVQMVKKSFGITFRSLRNTKASKHATKIDMASAPVDDLSNITLGGRVNVPFVGMAPGSTWVMYGDDLDLTLGMRNALAYDLTRAMGRWAANDTYVEVFLVQDGQPLSASHYWGVYLALEKIDIDPMRLNLTSLDSKKKDLSGGYVFGYERSLWPTDIRISPGEWDIGPCQSGDGRNLTYLLHDPSAKGAYLEQQGLGPPSNDTRLVAWAASYLGVVEAALVNDVIPQGSGLTAGGGGWRALVDQGAFIDYWISQEVPKNPDAHRGSVYMYKDRDRPLMLGPPWDFNEAWGMCCGYPIEGWQKQGQSNGSSGGSAISPEGWRFSICDDAWRCKADPVDGISLWWRATWQREPAFRIALATRWAQLRSSALSDDYFRQRFAFYRSQLAFAAPRNFMRWQRVLSVPNLDGGKSVYTYNVQAMETWTYARLRWMDAELKRVEGAALALLALPAGSPVREPLTPVAVKAIVDAAKSCAKVPVNAVNSRLAEVNNGQPAVSAQSITAP